MSRIKQLEEFLRESPEDPFLHYALTMEYLKLGDWLQTRKGFEHMVESYPDYVGTYYHYGKFLESLGEKNLAKNIYSIGVDVAKNANNRHAMNELLGAINLMDDEEEE